MYTELKIRDELLFRVGRPPLELVLGIPSQRISVRELIRVRVYHEVEEYNARQGEYFQGLVQPGEAEATLNGFRMLKRRSIDPARQYEQALAAFQRNGFVILVDERQVEELDELIEIRPETSVTFLRLVPLVGG